MTKDDWIGVALVTSWLILLCITAVICSYLAH